MKKVRFNGVLFLLGLKEDVLREFMGLSSLTVTIDYVFFLFLLRVCSLIYALELIKLLLLM